MAPSFGPQALRLPRGPPLALWRALREPKLDAGPAGFSGRPAKPLLGRGLQDRFGGLGVDFFFRFFFFFFFFFFFLQHIYLFSFYVMFFFFLFFFFFVFSSSLFSGGTLQTTSEAPWTPLEDLVPCNKRPSGSFHISLRECRVLSFGGGSIFLLVF